MPTFHRQQHYCSAVVVHHCLIFNFSSDHSSCKWENALAELRFVYYCQPLKGWRKINVRVSPSVLSSIVHQLECRALKATRSPRYFMFGRCNVYCIPFCMQYKKCVGAKYCCSDKCLCLWQQLVWHRPPSRASLVVEPWHSVPDTLQLPTATQYTC